MSKDFTLLYIEENAQVQAETLRLFSNLFETLYIAQKAEEGLALYYEHRSKLDLIITAITLSDSHTIDLLLAIRKNNPEIAMVVLYAHKETPYLAQTIEANVDAYLLKPLNQTQLTYQHFHGSPFRY